MASAGLKAERADVSCSDVLLDANLSFAPKSGFEEGSACLPAGGNGAWLRASESFAAFRLRARIARAAALLAAVFCCAVRTGASMVSRTAAAGLVALRRETAIAGVFCGADAAFPRAGLLPKPGLAVLPMTDLAIAGKDAPRLVPAARASTGFVLRAASFFGARFVPRACGAARAAEAFLLATGFAATGPFARRVAAAIFVFVPREDLLAAASLEARARAAAARLALSIADCFAAFA
ncbi:MAG: hypothetical protein ACT4O2_13260 [Beijerinckiaceae bacterium]